ncbi:MAG: hypothetical protein IKK92_00420 [Prevotella sp.]|nr:hypothetical protein [Prevotella sp.]MBQ2951733.1 hypothetical protein [Prevotella sp.]MBR2017701.1 hypothetical protein [Prevotella sp.]MBR2035362.1 hypothetical protein [Prevotella sp.]MBR6604327.1 hypothetical protein [Prevotella sp.]
MKKEMTMQVSAMENTNAVSGIRMMMNVAISMLTIIRNYYADVLGCQLNNKQTMLILNAQFAFLFTVFPIECSPIFRIVCLIWLVAALLKCKNSGIRTSD